MNIQELLTYVEELSFKTSMIGYDKDEVDIQLDKICDEMEAIVKEKDDEIAALRGGAPAAPVVVDLSENRKADQEIPQNSQEDSDDLRAYIKDLNRQLADVQNQLAEAEERAEAAEERAERAETEAEQAEEKLFAAEAELKELRSQADADYEEPAHVEKVSVDADAPQNKDEAYQLYLRNADLLCKQLEAVDSQKEAIVTKANQEAEGILEAARQQADENIEAARAESETILSNAWAESDRIGAEAESHLKEAEERAEQILEEGRAAMQQDKEDYQKLLEKKAALVDFMKGISSDISGLLGKIEESAPEE